MGKLLSLRSWWNALSGRSVYLRLRRRLHPDPVRPPGYYGLLTLDASAATDHARRMSARGMSFLVVLTGGAHRYCNYPGQVADSMPGAIREDRLQLEWRPEADHIFKRPEDRDWLGVTLVNWLARYRPDPEGMAGVAS